MAITGFNPFDSRFTDIVYSQTDAKASGDASISGTTKITLYSLKMATADAGQNFFKMYDVKVPSASLNPDIVIPVAGSGVRATMTVNITGGITFSNAISVRVCENAAVADATDPSHTITYLATIS